EKDRDIIYLTGDDTDTLYRGEYPRVPITSSFSEMEICLYDPGQKTYYQCLLRDQIVVGRSAPESTAQIQIADGKVSRKHCQIYRQGERILIQDLGSTNHTYLNHCRVTGATPLMYGDLLTIGSVTYQFQYTF
ncbi:MAG: FHA domain-containing protein, partial [Clostridiales bacterium]|nr:FHA domain-containing protein [Clostridiales bacterium]